VSTNWEEDTILRLLKIGRLSKNCGTGKIDMEFDEVTTTYKEI